MDCCRAWMSRLQSRGCGGFRSPSLLFHVTAFGLAHAGVLAALFAAVNRRARGLPHDAARLAGRCLRLDAELAKLAREPLPPELKVGWARGQSAPVMPYGAHGDMDMGMPCVVMPGH